MGYLVMRQDLYSPPSGAVAPAEVTRAALDQYRWADDHGFDMLSITEHHGIAGGWNPAPLTTAAMVLAQTSHAAALVSALVLPLHDPVRVAEQIAQIDLAAPGRLLTTLAAGYRREEFDMAGVEFASRGRLLEEYVGVMRAAWTGEPFEWRGREVVVTPKPATEPHPTIFLGGGTEVAARRAARLGLVLFPQLADPQLDEWYFDELGTEPTAGLVMQPSGPTFVWATDDAERTWSEIGEYVLAEARTYASWQAPGMRSANRIDATDVAGVRAAANVLVGTPDELITAWDAMGGLGSFVLQPLAGGIPTQLAWSSLDLFAREVLPVIRP